MNTTLKKTHNYFIKIYIYNIYMYLHNIKLIWSHAQPIIIYIWRHQQNENINTEREKCDTCKW